nr:hypothetical protein [uncultured Cetobacterium sp.]
MIRYVNTKDELKKAVKEKANEIIIVNDSLANQIKNAKDSSKKHILLLVISLFTVIASGFFNLNYVGWTWKILSLLGIGIVFYIYPSLVFSIIFLGGLTFYNIYIAYNLEIDESEDDTKKEVKINVKGKFILKLKQE